MPRRNNRRARVHYPTMFPVSRQKSLDERRRRRCGVRPKQRESLHLRAKLADVERRDARLDEFPIDDVHAVERRRGGTILKGGAHADHDVSRPKVAHGERLARHVNFCGAFSDKGTKSVEGVAGDWRWEACDSGEVVCG